VVNHVRRVLPGLTPTQTGAADEGETDPAD
jgi:hypothetical protein